MKKITLFLLLCLFWTGNIYAQNSTSFKYEGRPMPDWIMGATPEPRNSSYYYKVFEGVSPDREEARNKAIKKAFQQAISFIDATVNSSDVFAAVEKGDNLNVLSDTYHIPIYFTCEFSKKTPDGTQWLYWILCQIATRGNIAGAQFDTHFSDCNTHEIWDRGKENAIQSQKDAEKKTNTKAIVASAFIPGMGQMIKGQGGTGAAFLLSEVALFGGGTAFYFLADKQNKIMLDATSTYDEYKNAKNQKKTYDIAMYACFGVGVAVHVGNMVHAWLVPDKKNTALTFIPAMIPTGEFNAPTYAYGVGVQYKF